jgi:hypothetical protein
VSATTPTSLIERRVRFACYLALVALAMIAWALIHPHPLEVIVAMSVGQVIGTLSLLFFGFAIIADLRDLRRSRAPAPKTKTKEPA